MRILLATGAVLFSMSLLMPAVGAPATGSAAGGFAAIQANDSLLVRIQHRPHGAHRGGHYYHRRGGSDAGAVAAGAFLGFAIGAIVASEAQRQEAIRYCSRRYRSFDPNTMTFRGRDGRRYRCP